MNNRKTIFITGAASGIGRATAVLFAQNGWFVGIFDVNEEGLQSLRSEIGEENCFLKLMDVTDLASVKETVDAFMEKTGGQLNVLFNNAGIVRMGPNADISIEDQHKIVDINFNGCLTCIHHCLPFLRKTPGARIINMSSASAIYGVPEMMIYSATKHAVKAMTEGLNIELEREGIIVSDIMVPYVKTPLIEDTEVKAYSVEKMGVNVEPPQVAKTVWKAAHGKKLHWKMTGVLWILLILFWALPFGRRAVIKSLAMSPEKK